MSEPKFKVGEDLNEKLIVGARIKIGKEYAEFTERFKEGEVFTLVEGHFEYDNGLYTEDQKAPAIWSEKEKDFESIYHLFGNDLEDFKDCEVLSPIEEQTNLVAEGSNTDKADVAMLRSGSSNSVGQDFPKCTLTDKELIERSREWITKLCNSEGKAWCLRVPPDVNRDPDFLFTELCDRLNNELPVQASVASKVESSTVRPDNNSEKTMTSKDHSRLKEGEGIPRRIRLDLMEPAELIIFNAVQEIEKLPPDVRLTNAQILLMKAKDLVSDFVDQTKPIEEVSGITKDVWDNILRQSPIEPKEQVSNTDWKEEFKTKIKKEGLDIAVAWVSNDIVFPAYHIADYQEGQLKDLKSENERLRNLLAEAEQK